MLDIYTTAVSYHRQKQQLNLSHHAAPSNTSEQRVSTASHMKSLSVLPSIHTTTQRKQHHLLNTRVTNPSGSFIKELRKK